MDGVVTMDMVAKRAGVSRPTVSLVLNNRAKELGISAQTQQRVMEAVRELGYRRNELVRSVVTGKNRRLGFLAYNYGEHVLRLLAGAMEEAQSQGYIVEWHGLTRNREADLVTIQGCVEQRLPAVMVVEVEDEAILGEFHQELARHSIAVALMDSSFPHSWGVRVISDDEDGVAQSVRHLANLGHERIAFLAGDSVSGSSAERERGYIHTMNALGLRSRMERIGWSPHKAEEFVARMVRESAPPTALICANDMLALATMRAARRHGSPCPARLSVVGYANLYLTGLSDPPLTTVTQPFEDMGKRTVRALLDRLENEPIPFDQPEEIRVPVHLVERGSTAPPFLPDS